MKMKMTAHEKAAQLPDRIMLNVWKDMLPMKGFSAAAAVSSDDDSGTA